MLYLVEHSEDEAEITPLFCTCSHCGLKVLLLALDEALRDPDA